MQDIQKYVVELLFKHDCVIIPNLGGFVAQYKSAALDEVTGFFSPPSKQILFNINLKNNDGLLANEIAQRKQITYNDLFYVCPIMNYLIEENIDRKLVEVKNCIDFKF